MPQLLEASPAWEMFMVPLSAGVTKQREQPQECYRSHSLLWDDTEGWSREKLILFCFFGKVLCFAMEVPWPCYGSALKRQVTAAHQADTCHGPPNTAWPWDMVRAAVGHGRQRQQCSGCSGRSVISPFLTPRCDLCGAPLSALEQEWVSPG